MTWDEVCDLALALPGVEIGTSYGAPSLKAGGKLLTRLRTEDDSLVLLGVGFDEREILLEAAPDTFHLTDHYRNYPAILARLQSLDAGAAAPFLERQWRQIAPRRLIKAFDAARS